MLLIGLLLLLVLIALDHAGPGLYVTDDLRRYDGQTFEVVRVIDGDTLDLRVRDGGEAFTRIRLWGVDTPEMAARDGSRPAEPYAETASDYTRGLIEGRAVTLHLEPQRERGRYGRLLAYVELPDGTLLNARLIEAGLSPADDRWGHRRMAEFAVLEADAKRRGVGMWEP